MIGLLLFALVLFLSVYKLVALTTVRIAAFSIDYFLIFFFTAYYLHDLVSVKISSGNAVYFWDGVFGVLAIAIYSFIILTIHHVFPTVSKILNYVISFIGVSVAVPLATSFITNLINAVNTNVKSTDHIQLLNNPTADKVIYIIIFVIFSIPVWKIRMNKLNNR